MEISRKKITNEEIFEKESALANDIKQLVSDAEEKFSALGYELETEFLRDNDSAGMTDEEKADLRNSDINKAPADYENGYSSHVKITVKHKKTEEDILPEEENAEEDEILSEEEAENLRSEKEMEQAAKELKRSVAFTTMMLVRVYKTFWREIVSVSDNTEELNADIEEFYSVLEAKSHEGEEN
jgi:hypothetical protein